MANRTTASRLPFITLIAALAFATATPLPAADDGALSGVVTDAAGAAVPGVSVALEGMADNATRAALSDRSGRYSFERLPPQRYRVAVRQQGFLAYERELEVRAGSAASCDLELQIDRFAETVTVSGRISRVATKADTPVLEIPQGISIVPARVLEEQQADDLSEALRNVSGVNLATRWRGTYDVYGQRGFYSDSDGNFRRNGIELFKVYQLMNPNAERVEVLKGPSSVLYGRLDPGGVINVVTKEPLAERFRRLELRGGGFGYGEGRLDLTGPLGANRRLMYRLNGSYERRDSFRDVVGYEMAFVSPVLTWTPDHRTRWTLDLEYKREEGTTDMGFASADVSFAAKDRLPIETFFGEPDARFEQSWLAATSTFERSLGSRFRLRNVLNLTNFARDPHDVVLGGLTPDGARITRTADFRDQEYKYRFAELDFSGRLETGSLAHRLTAGANYQATDLDELRRQVPLPPVDLVEPSPTGLPPIIPVTGDNETVVDLLGVYVQDQIAAGSAIRILLGARYTRFDQDATNRRTGRTQSLSAGEWTPQAGVAYLPRRWLSLYASYARSFAPTLFIPASGTPYDPSFGEQLEGGVKADVLEGRLSATLSVFDLEKSNVLSFFRDPATGIFTNAQGGRHHSRGVELDVTGSVSERLGLTASYAYLDAEVVEDPSFPPGTVLGPAPRHKGSLWIHAEPVARFALGAGVFFQTEWKAFTSNTALLPGYVTADASASYRVSRRVKAQFNVKNVFDERYYLDGAGANFAYPASPRSWQVSLAADF
jgi:iron complex outermembrane receptor protein